jgi:uncharacterized damage-inducible protein DinB
MDWKSSWTALVSETLNGNDKGTWYVEGREALLPILRSMPPAQASARPSEKINSIAGHVHHTAYYMELAISWFTTGTEEKGDWDGSWKIQTVDAESWKAAVDRLESAADRLKECVAAKEFSEPDDLTYAWANATHLAFHLGSIRQLAQLT